MHPSVGRILHYYHDRHSEPQPALVAKVLLGSPGSPCLLNLALWNGDGRSIADPPCGIRFVDAGEAPPATGAWCCWPPRDDSAGEVGAAARRGFGSGDR